MSASCATGNLLFISGQLLQCRRQAGRQGQARRRRLNRTGLAAAQTCAVNLLAQIKPHSATSTSVVRVVRLGGFVNSAPDYLDGPKVLNGASDLIGRAFGDKGRHARTTVGVASFLRTRRSSRRRVRAS